MYLLHHFFMNLLLEFTKVCFYSNLIYKKKWKNIENSWTNTRYVSVRIISHSSVSICSAAAASCLNYQLFDRPIEVADPETG